MDSKQEFLILLRDYETLRETLKQKAWELTPSDIRELLCGEKGLLANNAKQALNWLIIPKWQLKEKRPIELIIEGKIDEVRKFLKHLHADVYD